MTLPEDGTDVRRNNRYIKCWSDEDNYDTMLIRFILMNMGPVASCCEHNDALSVYMNCEEFLVSNEGLCPIELILGYIL